MQTIVTTYNRRSFIRTSVAAGGGILFGFNFLAGCKPVTSAEAELAEAALDWNAVNAFIKIAPDGKVTIMSPNP
jgi:hypothetical protein